MSLNTAHANYGVLIHCGEYIMIYADSVELKFDNCNDGRLKGTKKGRLYLTSHRMIFTSTDKCDPLQSFSFPFFLMTNVELEQPTFGCNYIKGKIRSLPEADLHQNPWVGTAIFKLYFKSGGAIDFGMAMLQAAKMASSQANREPPPPYVPPMAPYYMAQPDMYTPPPGAFGMALPVHMFPNYPPANGVFMTDQPPPYPGINTCPPGYSAPAPPPGWNFSSGEGPTAPPLAGQQPPFAAAGPNLSLADAKAQEAAQSAYYDPNNPHYAYMPPQAPPYGNNHLPTYDEATKKSQ
uniref:WW domain-binding protein 2 n=1 Tax=Hemiscolopendra marginata TaxID=943146 RepID=A0A646QII0_9MYRI